MTIIALAVFAFAGWTLAIVLFVRLTEAVATLEDHRIKAGAAYLCALDQGAPRH